MSIFNLRIRGRLYGGFGALVLFGAFLAGFGVWQLWGTQADVADMTVQSKNTIRLGQITTELHAFRRAILRFEFDQDEPSFAEAEKRLTDLTSLFDEAAATTTSAAHRAEYQDQNKKIAELNTKRIELGGAIKQYLAGRTSLYGDGDTMAANVQKFVDAAKGTPFESSAAALESKVLLVRVANWRMLATRDPKGPAIFKTNVGKARAQIAELEKADLPSNLPALLAQVKIFVDRYATAFETVSTAMLLGDEIYNKCDRAADSRRFPRQCWKQKRRLHSTSRE